MMIKRNGAFFIVLQDYRIYRIYRILDCKVIINNSDSDLVFFK
jgi:hypothetical protein